MVEVGSMRVRRVTVWLISAILLLAAMPGGAQCENWPAWRGPRGDGTSLEKDLPVKWSAAENVWKTPRPNKTRSCCPPIVRTIDGRNQMILSGSLCVASYDLDTGRQHWIIDGPTEQYVASLVYNGDQSSTELALVPLSDWRQVRRRQ